LIPFYAILVVKQGKIELNIAFFSIFPNRENIEAVGERLNRQLQEPRQHAFGDASSAVA
jgi:hypothetical protein